MAAYAALLALGVTLAVVGWAVVRDVKRPMSPTGEGTKATDRPSAAECADLLADVPRQSAAGQPVSAEIRARLRQCLQRK